MAADQAVHRTLERGPQWAHRTCRRAGHAGRHRQPRPPHGAGRARPVRPSRGRRERGRPCAESACIAWLWPLPTPQRRCRHPPRGRRAQKSRKAVSSMRSRAARLAPTGPGVAPAAGPPGGCAGQERTTLMLKSPEPMTCMSDSNSGRYISVPRAARMPPRSTMSASFQPKGVGDREPHQERRHNRARSRRRRGYHHSGRPVPTRWHRETTADRTRATMIGVVLTRSS